MQTEPESGTARLLTVHRGKESEIALDSAPITLGRAPDNDIVLADPRASRHHARIEPAEDEVGAWRIVDLGSQNGTWLNGRRISRSALSEGDDLRIGSAVVRLDTGAGTSRHPSLASPGSDAAPPTDSGPAEADIVGRFQRVAVMARALCEDPSSEDLLQRIIDAAIDLAGAERGFLLIAGKNGMDFAAARDIDQTVVGSPEFEVSWSIAIAAGTRGETVVAVNAIEDPRFSGMASVEHLGLRSVMAVPIPGARGVVGAIYLDNRLQRGAFTKTDQEVISLLAAQAGIALTNRQLVQSLKTHSEEVDRLNREQRDQLDNQNAEISAMRTATREPGSGGARMIGESARMDELRHLIRKVAATDFPVLIHGESGTGKELVARQVHEGSSRSGGAFVALNCAAVPETLLETELFGNAKGAFTGADDAREGLFAAANGGTIFLDEVSEMSTAMQSRLLRVLQEGEYRSVGGKAPVRTNARVVAASHRELVKLVAEGNFREDLYYRLNVLPVKVPALRARREDIPILIQHFFLREGVIPAPRVTPEAMDVLTSYGWPGNVRELENEVRRLAALAGDVIDREALGRTLVEGGEMMVGRQSSFEDLNELVGAIEAREIKKALARSEGNKTKAAQLLGITRFSLQRKLEKYAIDL